MNIALPLIFFVILGANFLLMRRTGNAFPGIPNLATRARNPRLFSSYYFSAGVAVIAASVWLLIAIFQELIV